MAEKAKHDRNLGEFSKTRGLNETVLHDMGMKSTFYGKVEEDFKQVEQRPPEPKPSDVQNLESYIMNNPYLISPLETAMQNADWILRASSLMACGDRARDVGIDRKRFAKIFVQLKCPV